jgi:hypothetical protein
LVGDFAGVDLAAGFDSEDLDSDDLDSDDVEPADLDSDGFDSADLVSELLEVDAESDDFSRARESLR